MLTLLFLLLLFSLLLPIVVAVLVVPGDAVFCTLQSIEDDKDCVLGAFNGVLAKEMFFNGMTMVLAGVVFSVAEDITPFIFSC